MLISTKGAVCASGHGRSGRACGRGLYPPADDRCAAGYLGKYLESILAVLSKARLLDAVRGKGGGYRLSRELKDYSVGEILRLSEGSLAPVACLDGEVNRCPRAEKCQTLPVWEKLDELINGYLDSISLADLLHQVKDTDVGPCCL